MIELVVVWMDGEKDIYEYEDYKTAQRGLRYMRTAFGNQISWAGIRER